MENQYMDIVSYYAAHRTEYYLSVYLPIMVWMVLTLIFVIILFKRYTFGDWTKENPNPFEGETFQMPRGTFRGILTLTLTYITVILELANVRLIGFEDEIKEFMSAFQMMIAFYFGAKVMHHVTSVDKSKTKALAEASTVSSTTAFTESSEADEYAGNQFDDSYFEEEGAAG